MFVWRAIEEKVPTEAALRDRGMNLPDVICKTCGAAEETAGSCFTTIKIPMVNTAGNLKELLKELNKVQRNWKIRKAIHAIAVQTMWTLWRVRNDNVFKGKQAAIQITVEDIKENSYQGVKMKSKFNRITQQEWWDFNVVL
ncbi:uncharacterized protein LOC110876648 [Helianthus annuus]|uniref:uncharacterized protein LOC110876648 n=1 Tax=Helianthus annuus TaxID=4232 RepID=UPI000B8FF80B|nr:uncharacterized protein LOC110876648 [Helianthus annuus]